MIPKCYLKYLTIFGLCFLTQASFAEEISLETRYDIYWKGLRVFTLEGTTDVSETEYSHKSHMRSRGMLRWFLKANMDLEARGKLEDSGKPQAEFYRSFSKWNKDTYERQVSFNNLGKATEVIINIPEDNEEGGYREEVPEEFQISPDPMSMFVDLMKDDEGLFRNTQEKVTYSSFDGSRSMAYYPNCNFPPETLKKTGKSTFRGLAHYCEITLEQTGGFWHGDEDETDKARDEDEEQHPLKVWFAKTESGHYLPVKMEFKSGRGTLKIYLKELNQPIHEINTALTTEIDD